MLVRLHSRGVRGFYISLETIVLTFTGNDFIQNLCCYELFCPKYMEFSINSATSKKLHIYWLANKQIDYQNMHTAIAKCCMCWYIVIWTKKNFYWDMFPSTSMKPISTTLFTWLKMFAQDSFRTSYDYFPFITAIMRFSKIIKSNTA